MTSYAVMAGAEAVAAHLHVTGQRRNSRPPGRRRRVRAGAARAPPLVSLTVGTKTAVFRKPGGISYINERRRDDRPANPLRGPSKEAACRVPPPNVSRHRFTTQFTTTLPPWSIGQTFLILGVVAALSYPRAARGNQRVFISPAIARGRHGSNVLRDNPVYSVQRVATAEFADERC